MDDPQLYTANTVYIENTLRLLREYMQTLSQCFKSSAQLRDFRNQYEPTRLEINQWVEDQTNDKIKDLLPRGSVNSDTRMVLVNAIYFKGEWLRPFTSENQAQTLDGRFFPVPNHNYRGGTNVQTMNMKAQFLYDDSDSDFQVLGIPYKGNELTMFIFLSKSRPLQQLESSLSGSRLRRLMSSVRSRQGIIHKLHDTCSQVDVTMPKFKMTRDLELKRVLQSMGMRDMWENSADLSGMTGNRDLKVDDAFHKAFIEVNEKGTEAAAATAFIAVGTSAFVDPDPTFRADHPFIFLIKHHSSDTILFMGSLYDVSDQ